jgi:ABC-2 type transport system ATP-binding protein
MSTLLEVNNLTKVFYPTKKLSSTTPQQPFTAVKALSFSLKQGEILGFLGPNGAGKTTTIHMLLGLTKFSSGSIIYFGKDFLKNRSEILQKVGFVSTYVQLPAQLTVYETLDLFARLYGVQPALIKNRVDDLTAQFNLAAIIHKKVGQLSTGQRSLVMIAKAFVARPRVVLLDEPTAALDPDIAHAIRQAIMALHREQKTALLFTSHNMEEVTQLCGRVLVLQEGTLIANNTPEELAATVKDAKVTLIITKGMEKLITYLKHHTYQYKQEEHTIMVDIQEYAIASLLSSLAHQDIHYSHITIEKPTLEDYFLHIAQKKRERL